MPRLVMRGLLLASLLVAPARALAQATPPVAAPAPEPEPDQALDLQAILYSSEEQPQESSHPRLELYGFADFTFSHFLLDEDSIWAARLPTQPTFAIGNVNLYVDSQLSRRARSLFEVRFSLLPLGNQTVNPSSGQITLTDTTVEDYTTVARPTRWSGIVLERAQLTYEFHDLLQLTAGRFISPWGIWNVDHGTPVVIGVIAPFITVEQLIPRAQTGLQASGFAGWSRVRLSYFLTLSNGRGPVDAYLDFDRNKAVGGRLVLSTSEIGEFALGATLYYGRYTNPELRFVRVDPDGRDARVETRQLTQYDELAIGADLRWEAGGYLVVAEVTGNGRRFTARGRPLASGTSGSLPPPDGRPQLEPDDVVWGGYLLAGYRFAWLGVMPFAHIDYYNDTDYVNTHSLFTHVGLNIRPEAGLVLKLQYSMANLLSARPFLIGGEPRVQAFLAQLAWAF